MFELPQSPSHRVTYDYVPQDGDQVYLVRLEPEGEARAGVVLAGAFGGARHATYLNWRSWAEVLAAHGFEVLRFDYRGHGESTGRFEDFAFSDWSADLELCLRTMRARAPDRPLLLHGMQLGALLANDAFDRGKADGLLLWCPPPSGREMLYALLRQRLAADLADGRTHRTRDQYVADLEAGGSLEVGAFLWTERLWREAADFTCDRLRSRREVPASDVAPPWFTAELAELPGDGEVVVDPRTWVNLRRRGPDLSGTIRESLAWCIGVVKGMAGACARSSSST